MAADYEEALSLANEAAPHGRKRTTAAQERLAALRAKREHLSLQERENAMMRQTTKLVRASADGSRRQEVEAYKAKRQRLQEDEAGMMRQTAELMRASADGSRRGSRAAVGALRPSLSASLLSLSLLLRVACA